MYIIPRGYKVFSKLTSLPELFNLQFIKSNYQSDLQLTGIREMIKEKDIIITDRYYAQCSMDRYYAQFINHMYVKMSCGWTTSLVF